MLKSRHRWRQILSFSKAFSDNLPSSWLLCWKQLILLVLSQFYAVFFAPSHLTSCEVLEVKKQSNLFPVNILMLTNNWSANFGDIESLLVAFPAFYEFSRLVGYEFQPKQHTVQHCFSAPTRGVQCLQSHQERVFPISFAVSITNNIF